MAPPAPALLREGASCPRGGHLQEGWPRGALKLTDPWPPLRSHALRPQPPATPRAPPAADHPKAPNSRESSGSTLRLRPPRANSGPGAKKGRRAIPTRSQEHAPHLIARNFPPQLTNPKQNPDSRRRLPTSRPGQGSRGRAGRDREKVAGSFVWEKWEGPGGAGPAVGSEAHGTLGACFGRDESI